MRGVLIVLGLLVLGFAAGTTAVAVPYVYGSIGPCPNIGGFGDGPFRWWPYGTACPAWTGADGSASVAGTLAGVVVATLLLALGRRHRDQAWARAAFAAVLVLGVTGFFFAGVNAPFSLVVTCVFTPPVAFAADLALTPRGARSPGRSAFAAVVVVPTTVFVAVLGVFDSWIVTPASLVGAVAAAGAAWAWTERLLREHGDVALP